MPQVLHSRRLAASRRLRAAALPFVLTLVLAGAGDVAAQCDPPPPPYDDTGYPPGWMLAWATDAPALVRGPIDIEDPGGPEASHGTADEAVDAPTGSNVDVVSLGDGGSITLSFESGIRDGPGDDFAVYENGFAAPGGFYAELAFVEVSSNGSDFARFDAVSLRATPVSGGGVVDPHDYRNLAGKHPLGSGTGFDLAELADHPLVTAGLLDLTDVGWVRLVDVVGNGSTHDCAGRPVYDPHPTAFPTGGFDADAVGVLHVAPEPGALASQAAALLALAGLSRRRYACAARR